jgi:hypothetical protein
MSVMPAVVKVLALGLPTFHFGELARAAVGSANSRRCCRSAGCWRRV